MFNKKIFLWCSIVAVVVSLTCNSTEQSPNNPDKTVLIAILARNKEHVLPRYLKCIENQEYPKDLISVYIKTDNNSDNTDKLLRDWVTANKDKYKRIEFDDSSHSITLTDNSPHVWNADRFKALATIRNNSLKKAQEYGCDYYFVVDCDNFIAPFTLKELIAKDKPIVAPILRSIPEGNDQYSNFFYLANEYGYYKHHPKYFDILNRDIVGTFKVEVVHCTYLINSKHIDQLSYIDGTNDYEFVIFSREARKNNIDQYISNEKEYGTLVHFYNDALSLEEEKQRLKAILTMP